MIQRYDIPRTPKEKNGGLKRGVCYIQLDNWKG
jgi:hypothetical protein